jgi:hypothetical protein
MDRLGEDSFPEETFVFGQLIELIPEAGEGDDGHSLACFPEDKI